MHPNPSDDPSPACCSPPAQSCGCHPDDPFQLICSAPLGSVIYGLIGDQAESPCLLVRERSDRIGRYREAALDLRGACIRTETAVVVPLLFAFDPDQAVYETFCDFWRFPEDSPSGHLFDVMARGADLDLVIVGDSGQPELAMTVAQPLAGLFEEAAAACRRSRPWSPSAFAEAKAHVIAAYPSAQALWQRLGPC